jgi:hypothetical protein
MVQEYFTTGWHVSHVEVYCTCHVLCLGIRMCSSPLLFFICCCVSAISEVDGITLQNFTGILIMLWTLDFDIFNLLVVSGRLKLQENL